VGFGVAGAVELEPVEEVGAIGLAGAFERGDQHDVPLQTLGFVDGAEVDEIFAGAGFGVEALDGICEKREVDAAARLFDFAESLEEELHVGELLRGERDVAAEGTPGAFY
jgi:hypothetical protein